jgi:uncharacterized repeat protein (TIGR03803 family)
MLSSRASDGTQSRLHSPSVGRRLVWTKQAAAAIRGALTLAVLCVVLVIASRPVQAQSETTLYNFTGGRDGGYPSSSFISDAAGNFYGTTTLGGLPCPSSSRGCGTVFELSPDGNGSWNETVLYAFTGSPDGAVPYLAPMVFDKAGNLYGTTSDGGRFSRGAVFELSPVGSSWTETILYSFTGGAAGSHPEAGLIMDSAGNLYGTTSTYQDSGNVFELSPTVAGWAQHVIYAEPASGGLTMDAAGNIYGTTFSTVFELSPLGSGGWNPTVLHTFTGYPQDGMDAQGTLVFDPAGNLYGITYSGGAKNNGTVYKLKLGENGQWTEERMDDSPGREWCSMRPETFTERQPWVAFSGPSTRERSSSYWPRLAPATTKRRFSIAFMVRTAPTRMASWPWTAPATSTARQLSEVRTTRESCSK